MSAILLSAGCVVGWRQVLKAERDQEALGRLDAWLATSVFEKSAYASYSLRAKVPGAWPQLSLVEGKLTPYLESVNEVSSFFVFLEEWIRELPEDMTGLSDVYFFRNTRVLDLGEKWGAVLPGWRWGHQVREGVSVMTKGPNLECVTLPRGVPEEEVALYSQLDRSWWGMELTQRWQFERGNGQAKGCCIRLALLGSEGAPAREGVELFIPREGFGEAWGMAKLRLREQVAGLLNTRLAGLRRLHRLDAVLSGVGWRIHGVTKSGDSGNWLLSPVSGETWLYHGLPHWFVVGTELTNSRMRGYYDQATWDREVSVLSWEGLSMHSDAYPSWGLFLEAVADRLEQHWADYTRRAQQC